MINSALPGFFRLVEFLLANKCETDQHIHDRLSRSPKAAMVLELRAYRIAARILHGSVGIWEFIRSADATENESSCQIFIRVTNRPVMPD
jgi:hypothetical protein